MTIKLNDLATTHALTSAPGNFAAIAAYCNEYNTGPEAVIATMNAAMRENIMEFYSPVFPRGARFGTSEEVKNANLIVEYVKICPAPELKEAEVVVSGHAGTIVLLEEKFPSAVVIEGNVSPNDIAGKIVAGTLPPHLLAVTKGYMFAAIEGFDYAKDGDLSGDELRKRLVIKEAVTVRVC